MTPLAEHLRAEIVKRGPITFAEYMEAALYHPDHGYYSSPEPRTGNKGHFMTSPEVDAAFGELWTNAFRRVWEAVGKPATFSVVELGPGEGGFCRSVLDCASNGFGDAIRYLLVEPRASARERQRTEISDERVTWAPSIDEVSVPAGAIFANEVLDNQPVHLVGPGANGLVEVYVDADEEGLGFVDGPVSSDEIEPYLIEARTWPLQGRMQVGLAAVGLASRSLAAIERGAIFLIDYGLEAAEIYERGGNTVVTYSERGAGSDPFEDPGTVDITAHADWTGVRRALIAAGAEVIGPKLQADVLRALGSAEVDQRLNNEHEEALANGDGRAAFRVLSRRNALGALLNTAGLGGLQLIVGGKRLPEDTLSFLR